MTAELAELFKRWESELAALLERSEARVGALAQPQPSAPSAEPPAADQESRGMLLARLENMQQNGHTWLTITAVLALLNDCDMLASGHGGPPAGAAPLMANGLTEAESAQRAEAERYCLFCDKSGHRTNDCNSTHSLNTPVARELSRLANALQASTASVAGLVRCPNCDDTGDVHSITGEWWGICHCPAGQAARAAPQAAPVAPEPVKPDGRLHADGYFTWARRDGYAMDKKLPCDFYLAAPAAPAPAVQPLNEEAMKWRKAVQEAYGWLWHTNNEPMAPVPMWSPEQAAYQARKCLRELLTTAERGEAINAIAAHMDKIAGITAAPTKE